MIFPPQNAPTKNLTKPISSMEMVYLPTFSWLNFYGFHVGMIYNFHGLLWVRSGLDTSSSLHQNSAECWNVGVCKNIQVEKLVNLKPGFSEFEVFLFAIKVVGRK